MHGSAALTSILGVRVGSGAALFVSAVATLVDEVTAPRRLQTHAVAAEVLTRYNHSSPASRDA